MSLTQYLEFQEDQNMTKLLNFLELKRGEERGFFVLEWRREGVFCLGMEERGGLYSSGERSMNGRPFNEG